MATKTAIRARLEFWRNVLKKLQAAYLALAEGGVQSYRLEDRQLTHVDLPSLLRQIREAEKKADELAAQLEGRGARRAFAIVPRDW